MKPRVPRRRHPTRLVKVRSGQVLRKPAVRKRKKKR